MPKFEMKRIFFAVVLLLLVIPVLMAGGGRQSSGSGAQTGRPDVLRIATTPHIAASPIWEADAKGYFRDENIVIETTSFVAMAPAIAALASGDIDISYMGVGVHGLAARGQVKIFLMNNLSFGDYFIGNRALGVTDLASLRGKTIAVPRGSTGDMLVNLILKDSGFNPNDFEIVNMDAAGIVAGMLAGRIDACGIWQPFVAEIQAGLGANAVILGEGRTYSDRLAFIGSYGASERMFNNNRDLLVRFTRAYLRAVDPSFVKNANAVVDITLANAQANRDSMEIMFRDTDMIEAQRAIDLFCTGEAFRMYDGLISAMVDVGFLDVTPLPASQFIDTTIIRDAAR